MREIIGRYGTALAGLVLIVFFVAFAPNFATTMNIVNVLKDTSFLAILAIGFTLALIVSELDLSIAEVASLSAVVTGWLIQGQQHPALAVMAGLLVGILCGAANGYGVTVLRVPSLIMTLGTAAIARGFQPPTGLVMTERATRSSQASMAGFGEGGAGGEPLSLTQRSERAKASTACGLTA